jgi:hypothetical protein
MQATQHRLAAPTPTLTDVQRWALEIAEAHRWGVFVQAHDGTQLHLLNGYPRRALVLYLSEAAAENDTAEGRG